MKFNKLDLWTVTRLRVIALLTMAFIPVAVCLAAPPDVPVGYTVTNLGNLGGTNPTRITVPLALNNNGQVVGWSLSTNNDPHAFLWQNGIMIDIQTIWATTGGSGAYSINNQGMIVGYVNPTYGSGVTHAFVYQNGIMIDLAPTTPYNMYASTVNDKGEVWGYWNSGGFYYYNDILQNANQAGIWGGVSILAASDLDTLIVMSGPNCILINNLPYSLSNTYTPNTPQAINLLGQIAGYYNTPLSYGAFVWTPLSANTGIGTMKIICNLGGDPTMCSGINNWGQAVGISQVSPGVAHGFVWDRATGTIDLNTKIPTNSGWVIVKAYSINDPGQIIAVATYNGGTEQKAVLLTPTN